MQLVLDASVAIKWYLPEENTKDAIELKEWVQRGSHTFVAPSLFYSELTNILWKRVVLRHEMDRQRGREIIHKVLQMPLQVVPSQDLISDAFEIAAQHGCSAYDALYLAVLAPQESRYVTADVALIRRMSKTGLASRIVSLVEWKKRLS